LKEAFEKGLIPGSLSDPKYFNVKLMQLIDLK
ncbi:MAG: SDR family NAD-dependent epimerase/dehydratase, partial [Bacteroidetes bacterium]